mmetsp:Transcript_16753/g.26119  ORF Transcript_16753/g.26119 Transcript_16753/m.26119 type:complete len:298 (-) Transcript_16753:124-1017(-)
MPILLFELQQLFVPVIPIRPVPHLPNEAKLIQLCLPLICQHRGLSLRLGLELTTLISYPLTQFGVLGVVTRHTCIPILTLVGHKCIKVLLPKGLSTDVPLEINCVQYSNTIGIQEGGRGLIVHVELIMPPLRLDPIEKSAITRIIRRDVQIPILRFEEDQLIQHGIPGLLPATEIFTAGGEWINKGAPLSRLIPIGSTFNSIGGRLGDVAPVVHGVLYRWECRGDIVYYGLWLVGGGSTITTPFIIVVNCCCYNVIFFFHLPLRSTSRRLPSRSCLGFGLLCCRRHSQIDTQEIVTV